MELFPLRLSPLLSQEDAALYYRASGAVTPSGAGLALTSGTALRLDTHYNCFSYGKYRDYTVAEHCRLRLRLRGDCTVRLCLLSADGSEQTLAEQSHTGDEDAVLPFQATQLSGQGLLYPVVIAESGCVLSGGAYETDAAPTQTVSLALLICTFRREDYVRATLARVAAYRAATALPVSLRVYVADNGQTLDTASLSNDWITIMPNRNLGGSGGFARCMMACGADVTHMLIMDDDIVFDSAVLAKTLSFLLLLRPQHFSLCLGGAMLPLDNPHLQFEAGGRLEARGVSGIGRGLDLRDPASLLQNETLDAPDYQAWWYCCLPRTRELPFPFFIKYDDVEHGIRLKADILVLTGISVVHESFDGKWSEPLNYYDIRNLYTAMALCGRPLSRRELLHQVWYWVPRRVGTQRYYCAALYLRAIHDYLAGPAFFARTDGDVLHRALTAEAPHMLTPEEMTEISAKRVPLFAESRTLCKGQKRLLHIHPVTGKGYLTTRSVRRAWSLGLGMISVTVQILLRAAAVGREYPAGLAAVTSWEAWTKRLKPEQN